MNKPYFHFHYVKENQLRNKLVVLIWEKRLYIFSSGSDSCHRESICSTFQPYALESISSLKYHRNQIIEILYLNIVTMIGIPLYSLCITVQAMFFRSRLPLS